MRQLQKWMTMVVMMISMACTGFAGSTPDAAAPAPVNTPDAILGFETLSGWQATVGVPTAQLKLTPVRTQGSFAFSVTNPGNSLKLTSMSVSSGATALVGLGAQGATIAVDIRFPVGRNSSNTGSMRLSLTSPSRGLSKAPLGKVDFLTIRPGTFQTIIFPLTDQARNALVGAKFNDLSFEIALTQLEPGEYVVDNLRIRSTQGVTADATTKPPAGYGGSVDFDLNLNGNPSSNTAGAPGVESANVADSLNAPVPGAVEQTFSVGPIQIPAQFHLKSGTADAGTSVQLDLGYSPTSIIATCLYLPDLTDAKLKTYVFSSCTGGSQPGDITSASWARLGIINGVSPMRIRAQLAQRPLGDQVGTGIIPPMPTFWGDEDTCIVAPVAGQVVSRSQSCIDTLAQTSKIVDDYFKAATAANPAIGWIVPPLPENAKRHGDGSPDTAGQSPTPLLALSNISPLSGTASNPINESGHVNKGGLFDAYWALNGGINYNSFPDSDRATTHLDADFSTHGVVMGIDVNVLDVFASADTDTGQTTPVHLDPASNVQTHLHVLGIEYPAFTTNSAGQISKDIPLFSPAPLELVPIRIWIFKISAGVRAQAGLSISGGLTARGVDLTVTPQGSVQATLFGGVDVFIASGGVQADVDLIRIKDPIAAYVSWSIDPSPASCSGTITGTLDNDLTISSGGGEVDLVASFGLCPFCDDESMKLFGWDPLFQTTIPVLHETLNFASFPLPASLCTGNAVTASIQAPTGTVIGGIQPISLSGIAFSNNTSTGFGTPISCSNFTWSVTPATDTIHGVGCDASISFADTPHQAQILLSVSHTVTDSFGRLLTETGSASTTVSVTTLTPGIHITSVDNLTTNKSEPFRPLQELDGPAPGGYIITSTYVPIPGVNTADVTYKWAVQYKGVTTDLTCNFATNPDPCVFGKNLVVNPLQDYWQPTPDPGVDGYTVTVTAVSKTTGAVIGSDSFVAFFYNVVR